MPSSLIGQVAMAVGGGILSGMFGGKESSPAPAPTPEPVTPMPTANDQAVKDAKKKSIAAMTARQGRASTILSADDSSGGGGGTLGA